MKKFKIDVLWSNNENLDSDAIQDYISAESKDEAEEIAICYLEDNCVNVAKEVIRFDTREIE